MTTPAQHDYATLTGPKGSTQVRLAYGTVIRAPEADSYVSTAPTVEKRAHYAACLRIGSPKRTPQSDTRFHVILNQRIVFTVTATT